MRISGHMVRGEAAEQFLPRRGPNASTHGTVCRFLKRGRRADPVIAVGAESIRRKPLRNMVMFARKDVGFGSQPEHL